MRKIVIQPIKADDQNKFLLPQIKNKYLNIDEELQQSFIKFKKKNFFQLQKSPQLLKKIDSFVKSPQESSILENQQVKFKIKKKKIKKYQEIKQDNQLQIENFEINDFSFDDNDEQFDINMYANKNNKISIHNNDIDFMSEFENEKQRVENEKLQYFNEIIEQMKTSQEDQNNTFTNLQK